MKKTFSFILLALFCICGYAQTIDPVLLQEMGQRRGNEKIRVFVIMRQQCDQQRLNSRAAYFTTRSARREYVVNELKQFSEATQYDLRRTLAEMRRSDLVSEPKVLWIANAISFEATKDAILSLADRSDIMVIGFDEERDWLPDGEESQPADPTREITSNVTQVNADQVWNLGYTGQGVVVALIDTGVNYNHLDLADHLWDGGPEFPHHGYDIYYDDNDPMDDRGHGTHCAGTICGDGTAGSQTGIAPDATLMCVKCFNSAGRCNDTHVINSMQWALEHGCDVMSLSLGGHGHSGAAQTLERNTCVNVLTAGVIASIAAGNEGDELSQYPIPDNIGLPGGCPPPYLDPEQEQNPGGLSCSVCVGAVDSDDQAAYFTSHGPRDWTASDYADYPYTPGSLTEFGLIRPDVCAPGVYIKSADYSSNTGYTTKSGTSMATPCVAGCMALMLSKNIDATPAELCRILEETAVPLSTGKSNIYGYGRVDVLAAINAMYSGPLTLDSFTVNDGQGNNDGKLNAGEAVTLNLSLTNDSDVALDGATMVLTTDSEYVTITNGTASLPHFGAGQTRTINNIFAFTLSDDAPAKRLIQLRAETFVNGESVGIVRIAIMVYGHILRFVEVAVLNDNNGNGVLDAGETANLHVTVCNIGNEAASSVVGTLSTTYPYLVINSNNKSFGTIDINGQASADFNVRLTGSAPESYTIELSLDLVDANQKHTDVDFELWRKAITLTSNPAEGGTLGGGGYYGQGQTCTITANANPGYAFVKWTLNGSTVSYLSAYTFEVTGDAEYVAHFQAETHGVVIGDGAGGNSYLPTCVFNQYVLSQQIYTADELNLGACDITGVSFFNTTMSFTRDLTIYMVNTNKTAFDSNTDWIPVTEADQVFSGSFSFGGYSWTTIYFDTVFVYDGSSNIALIVDDNSGSFYSYSMPCRVSSTESCQALSAYGYFTNYNPYSPNYSGTQYMEKNQVIFGVASYDYTVTVSANPSNGGTVSGGGGPYYYGYSITLTATPAEGYVFNYWTKNGEVVSCLSNYDLNVTESANYVAHFQQVDGIVVGDASNTSAYLPTYTYYPYSLSQQIYTAEEMGGEATQISSISLFNAGTSNRTRNLSIYMIYTNKSAFENNSDWITVTEADQVFSGSVTFAGTGWTSIVLDVPFLYNGTSNVALIVDDNTNSWYSGLNCRTFGTDTNQALRIYGSDVNYDPYNPTGYTGTLMSMKNQVIFHRPSTVTATASPTVGGMVSGSGSYAVGATCTVTATANAGYYFLNWTENGTVVSYDAAYSFTVDGDRDLVANFIEGESNCSIVFDLYSSWGYGWYGNYLVVDYGNGNTEQLTLSSGSSISYSREVATGSTIALSWVGSSYTYQCSFDVKFENGVLIYQSSSLSSSFQQDLNINCAVATAPRTITAVADPIEGGTVEGAGTYESGTLATMTATPNAGYGFCFWSENGQQVSTDASYSFLVSSDRNLVARFSLPLTVSVTTNMASGGTATGAGTYYYGNTCTLTATPNEGYLFLNWSKNGEVVSCNASYNLTVTEDTEIEAVFMRLEGTLIGQGESTNSYLPSCSYWNYTMSQQIYTPNEIGGAGNITSISYYNGGTTKTRTYNIYMVHTDKIAFSGSTDWIAVTEADRVYSGSVNMAKGYWNTIVLDTPFAYDGTSNLAVIVDDNTGSWSSGMACRVFSAQSSQAIYIYSDDTNYDPYNPSSYSGTRSYVKNQIILGFMTSTAQTIELSEGWNWISTYIDLNEVNGIAMLEEALGDYGVTIQTYNESADYFGDGEWSGLEDYEWTNAEMVMVEVSEDCTIDLAGPTVDPGTVEIEIHPGWNWIGFPVATETAIGVAMAGFEAEEEDAIQSNVDGTSDYLGEWVGDVLTLVPGQGYMYYSNSTEPKTLVFSTTAKGKSVITRKRKE